MTDLAIVSLFAGVYAGMAADAVGESYCTTDACEVKLITENTKNK